MSNIQIFPMSLIELCHHYIHYQGLFIHFHKRSTFKLECKTSSITFCHNVKSVCYLMWVHIIVKTRESLSHKLVQLWSFETVPPTAWQSRTLYRGALLACMQECAQQDFGQAGTYHYFSPGLNDKWGLPSKALTDEQNFSIQSVYQEYLSWNL